MSRHLATPSEKREGSLVNHPFPYSLTFPSPLFLSLSSLPHSFFLFTISCFILFYFAGGHLGCRWGLCGLNRNFPFIIALCFVFFTQFSSSSSLIFSCLTCLLYAATVALPPSTLWRPCVIGPCTNGTVEVRHPSWRCVFGVRYLGFSTLLSNCRLVWVILTQFQP